MAQRIRRLLVVLETLFLTLLLLSSSAATVARPAQPGDVPIDHLIIFYQENHTFDNLYGQFPGANGLDKPSAGIEQVNEEGKPYKTLPQPLKHGKKPDKRFPADLPNAPFLINPYVPPSKLTGDPVHGFYQYKLQMNNGKMNKNVAWTDLGGLSMGHYETKKLPLYPYARSYTLADNYFAGAFGESMLNHFWLFCACTPVWKDAPKDMVAHPRFDKEGNLIGLPKDGFVTPDGHVVNDVDPVSLPHDPNVPAGHRMPPQTMPNIGERLSEAGVSWVWYSSGWDVALGGKPIEGVHPLPTFFKKYAYGTRQGRRHVKDESELLKSLKNKSLPAVSFVTQFAPYDEHPGHSPVLESERHIRGLIEKVKHSPEWDKTAIIVTYDDFGGWYDHVAPPEGDRWGPGGRLPMLVVSPYARKGYVDHTTYNTTSILRFIEWRYGLKPLAKRDAEANNLLGAFDFEKQGSKDSGGISKGVLAAAAVVGLAVIAAGGMLLWRRA
jgi:acid phosphatase